MNLKVHDVPQGGLPFSLAWLLVERHTEGGGLCEDLALGDLDCELRGVSSGSREMMCNLFNRASPSEKVAKECFLLR